MQHTHICVCVCYIFDIYYCIFDMYYININTNIQNILYEFFFSLSKSEVKFEFSTSLCFHRLSVVCSY